MVVIVTVTLPEFESDAGLMAQVAAMGKPVQLSVTGPVAGARVIASAYCAEEPADIMSVAGVMKLMLIGKTRSTVSVAVLLERSVSPPPETLDVI